MTTGTDGTFPKAGNIPSAPVVLVAAVVIGGMPFWFAGSGLRAYFTADDMMNLYLCWAKPWGEVLVANLAYWSPFCRPMGGLFYRSMYAAFGFDPFPFRVACFVLVLINLGLAYTTARRLAGSREAGLLTALIACYHGGFEDLYYNTGTVYDLLCFTSYVAAFLVYVRGRESGRGVRWGEIILVVGLYVCALNSKEMAVTLPLAVLIYEWVYHRPELTRRGLWRWIAGDARMAWLLGVMAVPYLYGKLSEGSPLTFGSDYKLHISLERYLGTYGYYLDRMFYRPAPWFTPTKVLLLWAGMLLVAALSRRKAVWFSLVFVWLSVLPVIFVTPRGTIFVLYIPFLGWSLYGAALLVWVRDSLAGGLARLSPTLVSCNRDAVTAPAGPLAYARGSESASEPRPSGSGLSTNLWYATLAAMRLRAPVTFAAAALVLFLGHQAHTFPTRLDSILRSAKEQLHAMAPSLPANSRVLFLDDPFDVDDWSPFFLIRLSYADATVEVNRVKRMKSPPNPSEIRSYDLVLTYRDERLVRVDPAQAGAGGP